MTDHFESLKPLRFGWLEPETFNRMSLTGWCAQQKFDGVRCMVKVDKEGDVSFVNAGGEPLVQAAAALHFDYVRDALRGVRDIVLDAELLPQQGKAFVFDVPHYRTLVSPDSTLEVRLEAASALCEQTGLSRAPTAYSEEAIRDLVNVVRLSGAEGVVLKRLDSTYDYQCERTSDWLKLKVYREIDCIVTARNTGACNARLGVWSGGTIVDVGSASMIGKPDAQVGDVVEVKYLSWQVGGALVQPSVLRIRDDKRPEDCSAAQLVPAYRGMVEVAE